eukprot:CAMPEP_0179941936 /NCGR_PEP_ID=MMETSP0983-20121128/17310_1 /TAXON_ID=483367 /ORGANISM="non described non described, Strain CCMP 2436" /LENGTH=159 /DNA_ID=CAMNT_0021849127 /DNA_START=18 /DNA_END=494 /DNA_ORIENTATION=-
MIRADVLCHASSGIGRLIVIGKGCNGTAGDGDGDDDAGAGHADLGKRSVGLTLQIVELHASSRGLAEEQRLPGMDRLVQAVFLTRELFDPVCETVDCGAGHLSAAGDCRPSFERLRLDADGCLALGILLGHCVGACRRREDVHQVIIRPCEGHGAGRAS